MPRQVERAEGQRILVTGAILAGLGVAAGALGAHLLRERLTEAEQDIWRTAASYQMYHALALIVVGRLLARQPSRLLRATCVLFVAGILFFSGGLYLLALSGEPAFGSMTPIGGAAFLAAWGCLVVGVVRAGRS